MREIAMPEEYLLKAASVMELKRQDYTTSEWSDNFELAAMLAGTDVRTVLMVMIGTKVARLQALFTRGKGPNFESVEDTLVDLANYAALLAAWEAQSK